MVTWKYGTEETITTLSSATWFYGSEMSLTTTITSTTKGRILTDIIADLEKQPRENFWETRLWEPGFWDECRLLRGIIREQERQR